MYDFIGLSQYLSLLEVSESNLGGHVEHMEFGLRYLW